MKGFYLGLSLFGLAACSGLTTVNDAQTAVNKTAAAVSAISTSGTPTLTQVQDAVCAGQAIANAATDMLTNAGYPGAAATSSNVSAKLGTFCP